MYFVMFKESKLMLIKNKIASSAESKYDYKILKWLSN